VTITTGFIKGEGKDTLTFDADPAITGSFDANTGVLSFSGNASVESYTRALRSVIFQPATDPTDLFNVRKFTLSVSDDGSLQSNEHTIETALDAYGTNNTCAELVDGSHAMELLNGEPKTLMFGFYTSPDTPVAESEANAKILCSYQDAFPDAVFLNAPYEVAKMFGASVPHTVMMRGGYDKLSTGQVSARVKARSKSQDP
jgi:hypothetical protein